MADGVTKTDDADAARLEYYIRQFDDAEDNTRTERKDAQLYRDYYDGEQWTSHERSILQKRGQPCITDNRLKDKVEYLLGLERKTRTDPKAFPRNPTDDTKSEAATDALRFIADQNHFAQVKSKVAEEMWIEGLGAAEVIVEPVKNQPNPRVCIRRIRWDRFYRDPYAMQADFSDAQYMGIVIWMDIEKAKAKYGDLAESFDALMSAKSVGTPSDTYDDTPRWVDRSRKRVQILEHYHKVQEIWHRCVFSKAGIIEKAVPSPYQNEYGEPDCPIVAQSCYIDRQGQRYGVVKRYKDLQDEINKRRSKALHLLSVRQIITEDGAVEDIEKLRQEAARPDGVLVANPGARLEIDKNIDLAEGQFKLLVDALQAMAATGPNEALQGLTPSQSGRAKEIDQQGGAIQLGILFDMPRFWQLRCMRAAWNRVRQYWTAEQWIRVTDDEKMRFVGLNVQQVPPEMQQVVKGTVDSLAELDVDIIIDEVEDTPNLQNEQWMKLTELAAKGVPIPPDLLIQASGLKNKQQLIDALKEQGQGLPPQVMMQLQQKEQEFAQVQELQQQKDQELQQAEAEVTAGKSELQKMLADIKTQQAQIKVMAADLDVKAANLQVAEAQLKLAAAGHANEFDRREHAMQMGMKDMELQSERIGFQKQQVDAKAKEIQKTSE